jgi:hypothetical protein
METALGWRRGWSSPGWKLSLPLLATFATVALAVVVHGGTGSSERHASARAGLGSLPVAARGPVSQAIGADERGFWVHRRSTGLVARNPAQGFVSRFSPTGLAVSAEGSRLELSLEGSRASVPAGRANRVTYHRAGLEEWYANGPYGLEQGFTVAHRPAGALTLALRVGGSLRPETVSRNAAAFVTARGRAVLRYTGLHAIDARGRTLPAWLSVRGAQLLIHLAATGVQYPVRIDPFIRQATLRPQGDSGYANANFGATVALSADGRTALIGGPDDNGRRGAAWVFKRSDSTWVQVGDKLTPTGETGNSGQFGVDVAISADGRTALIGSSDFAAWVFTRSGSRWIQAQRLAGKRTASTGFGAFGSGVALAADGKTALVGGDGAVWPFVRSRSGWKQRGPKLTAPADASGNPDFGCSGWRSPCLALSHHGNTALIGGEADHNGVGAAWVFGRAHGVWKQQGPKLTASDESGAGRFGMSVALSTGGNVALVGGPKDRNDAGAAWVFTRTAGAWSQHRPKLTPGDENGAGEFGFSVALSDVSQTALIAAPEDDNSAGAAWVYRDSGGVWIQQGKKLQPNDVSGPARPGEEPFASSVALSSAGNTALIGGAYDNNGAGAFWAFTRSGAAWSQQGSKLTARDESRYYAFGTSVAIAYDGWRAVVGDPGDGNGVGAVWIFRRGGGTWHGTTKLTASDESGYGLFGASVSISETGNTVLVGGPRDDGGRGAAWVFSRLGSNPSGSWTQQGPKLTPSGQSNPPGFGFSVALAPGGSSGLIGTGFGGGGVWYFRSNAPASRGVWSQQGPMITGVNQRGSLTGNGEFGFSVALSDLSRSTDNTKIALVGGPNDDNYGGHGGRGAGAVWVLKRFGNRWKQTKVTGPGFGKSVAVSLFGHSALVGGNGTWVLTVARSGTPTREARLLTRSGRDVSGAVALSPYGDRAVVAGSTNIWSFTFSGHAWRELESHRATPLRSAYRSPLPGPRHGVAIAGTGDRRTVVGYPGSTPMATVVVVRSPRRAG